MKRLTLFAVSLCLILVLLMAGARSRARSFVGSTQFEPPGFGNCDGAPCFLGIIPGKTKLTDAVNILSRWGKIYRRDQELHFYVVIDGKDFIFNAYFSKEYVDSITAYYSPPVPIDAILERYGPPCGIRIDKPDPDRGDTLMNAQIGWYYRGVSFLTYLGYWKSDHFSPNMVVHQITLQNSQIQDQYNYCGSDLYGDPHTIGSPWLGFTSYKRYQQYKFKADTAK